MADEPGRPRWVAGALGPTNRTASLSPDVNDPGARAVTFAELEAAYDEQARGPARRRRGPAAGRDDLRHAQRQGGARRRRASASSERRAAPAGDGLGDDHRPLRPHALGPDGRGLLDLGRARAAARGRASTARSAPREMRPTSRSCRGSRPCFVSAYPNAGLPNAFGGFDETPESMARDLGELARAGLRQHRRRLLRHDAGAHPARSPRRCAASPPRVPAAGPRRTRLRRASSRSCIRPDSNFVNVGERTNVTGSPRFAKLIQAGEYDEALDGRAPAGRGRRADHRRQHGRGDARLGAGDDARS